MPVDPNIVLGFKPPPMVDPLEMANNAQVISMNRMKMDAAEQEANLNAMLAPHQRVEAMGKASEASAKAEIEQYKQIRNSLGMLVSRAGMIPQENLDQAYELVLQDIDAMNPKVGQLVRTIAPTFDPKVVTDLVLEADQKLKNTYGVVDIGGEMVERQRPEYGAGAPVETGRWAKTPDPTQKPFYTDTPSGVVGIQNGVGFYVPMGGGAPSGGAPAGGGGAPAGGAGTGYNATYGHGAYVDGGVLTNKPIGQIRQLQKQQIEATRGKLGRNDNQGTGAMGAFQITYGTLAKYGPRVLGADWESQPFSAANQDALGRAIYEDNRNGDLSKVWAGLPPNKPGEYSNVPWEVAKDRIMRVESGGGGGGAIQGKAAAAENRRESEQGMKVASSVAGKSQTIRNIDAILAQDDATLDAMTGWFQGRLPSAIQSGVADIGNWMGVTKTTGQKVANAQALVDQLGSEAALGKLAEMRESSPTGGAVGQVTEREYPILQAAVVRITQTQDAPTFKAALMEYKQALLGAIQRVHDAYVADFGREPPAGSFGSEANTGAARPAAAPAAGGRPSDIEDLRRKYGRK